MNIPTIRPTSCPTSSELADKSKQWAIVYSTSGRGYLGRLVDATEPGIVKLADVFDYASGRRLVKGERGEPRVQIDRAIFPCEHTDVDELLVSADVIIPLSRVAPRLLESLREEMIGAWEGREHLRKIGGRVAVVSSVSPVSTAT